MEQYGRVMDGLDDGFAWTMDMKRMLEEFISTRECFFYSQDREPVRILQPLLRNPALFKTIANVEIGHAGDLHCRPPPPELIGHRFELRLESATAALSRSPECDI